MPCVCVCVKFIIQRSCLPWDYNLDIPTNQRTLHGVRKYEPVERFSRWDLKNRLVCGSMATNAGASSTSKSQSKNAGSSFPTFLQSNFPEPEKCDLRGNLAVIWKIV